MSDWQPEAREVPAELTKNFEHPTSSPQPTNAEIMAGSSILDRLDQATADQLLAFARGVL